MRLPLGQNRRRRTECVSAVSWIPSDPEIVFDEYGACNHCARAELLLKTSLPGYKSGEYRLDRLVRRIGLRGRASLRLHRRRERWRG